jgi:hypothetical protein
MAPFSSSAAIWAGYVFKSVFRGIERCIEC